MENIILIKDGAVVSAVVLTNKETREIERVVEEARRIWYLDEYPDYLINYIIDKLSTKFGDDIKIMKAHEMDRIYY